MRSLFKEDIIKPDVTYHCEIVVDKPLPESWAVTQDEEKLAEWLDGFQRVEHISGVPGEVGSVSDVYFDNNGQTMSIREEITEIIPNESISMIYKSDFMNMEYKLAMTAVDNKTKVNSSTRAYGNGMFSRSIMALIGGGIKQQEEMNLVNLRRTIEENKKNYFVNSEAGDESVGETDN